MKRRILGIITILALVLGVGAAVPALAADVTVSVDAPEQVSPASDFTVNINITEVADFDACNYDISCDVSVLRLDGVTPG